MYFPPQGKQWEERDAGSLDINSRKLQEAVDFAMANEYSGEKDLRIAILKGFAKADLYAEIVVGANFLS